MNSQNNYKINEFSLFPLYGWCINYRFLPYFKKIEPKKTNYPVENIKKIDYSLNLDNKFNSPYGKDIEFLAIKLKERKGILC